MKIILATEYFPESETGEITGGVESRAFYVAKELARRHKVFVITSRRPGSNLYDSFCGITIMRVGKPYPYTQSGHIPARLRFSISASMAARKLVGKEKIDVVDGYNFFTYPVPIYATLWRKAKGFLTYHEVWVGSWIKNTGTKLGIFGEIFERKILLLARLMKIPIIAVSGFTRDALTKAGADPKRVVVINNGVELSRYGSIRAIKAKQPTVCFIGRLTKNKRVEDLVKSVSIARKKIKDIRCVIVGIGPELDNLRKLATKLRLSKNIHFEGFVDDHKDVLKMMKSSTVFCSPDRKSVV
jgi:glycosyltransferase involved in cell wall biosynthesis